MEQCGVQYRVCAAGRDTLLAGTLEGDTLHFDIEGHRRRGILASTHDGFTLYLPEGACHFHEEVADTGEIENTDHDGGLRAPMNGTIVALLAPVGTRVETNTPLLIMEAMKMEHTLRAPYPGTVQAFHFQSGDLVDGGTMLLDFVACQE